MQFKTKKNISIYIKYFLLFFSVGLFLSLILTSNIWLRMRVKPKLIVWSSIFILTLIKLIFNINLKAKYFYVLEFLIIIVGLILKRLPSVIYDIRDSLFINLPISKFTGILIILLVITNIYVFKKIEA